MAFYIIAHMICRALLLLLSNVLFWGRYNFQISFSERDMMNVSHSLLGSDMVDTKIKQCKIHYPTCYMTFWRMTICSDTLHLLDIISTCDLVAELDLITAFEFQLREVFINHLQTDAACLKRALTHSDTWTCPIWHLHMF